MGSINSVFSLAYIVTAIAFQSEYHRTFSLVGVLTEQATYHPLVGSIGNCNALLISTGVVGAIAIPANSFLMFLRVRAVYAHNKPVVYAFAFLWVATLASCVSAPFAPRGAHIGTTQRCIDTEVKAYGSAGIVISAVNDTLIFFAITYRLLVYHCVRSSSWSSRVHSFFRGDGLGEMSKLLLQTGQLYYMCVHLHKWRRR